MLCSVFQWYVTFEKEGQIRYLDVHASLNSLQIKKITRFYGVMVSTLDSESSDPSSNLGRTL